MPETAQLLKCPACGATLNPPAGQGTMVCPYCQSSVIINIPAPSRSDEDDSDVVIPPPIGTPGFATKLLSFGSEGSKPGKINFSEAIGVDQNGNIYLADYLYNKRIDIFDSTGKFLRLIDLSQKIPDGMAVARDGTIYVVEEGDIHRLDTQGKDTRLYKGKGDAYISRLTIGPDGSLYASDDKAQIIRLSPSGKVELTIKKVFTPTLLGEKDIFLAADGQGNIYAGVKETRVVMKYSSKGKLLGQFGGKADDDAETNTPGSFSQLFAIAVDGYGRIYASNFVGVQVFDPDFHYLNSFAEANNADEAYSVFGMTFDSQNNLYMITDAPEVIKMSLPEP